MHVQSSGYHDRHNTGRGGLRIAREIGQELLQGRQEVQEAPLFKLAGLVIGNGLTDPSSQVLCYCYSSMSCSNLLQLSFLL